MKYYAGSSLEISKREIDHIAEVRKAAADGMVLLENNGALPLKEPGKIALFGAGARGTIKGGTGSGDVNQRFVVTVEEGLRNAGFEITTEQWIDDFITACDDSEKTYAESVIEKARTLGIEVFQAMFSSQYNRPAGRLISAEDLERAETDTAVFVIARNSGEGADRKNAPGDYQLYPEEYENIRILSKHFEKTIVVLNVGGVIDTKFYEEIGGISALLLMSQAGQAGGDALADVLLGKVTPSGKLTTTWAKNYGDYPSSAGFSSNDGNVETEWYTEGIYVGYRYFDTFGMEVSYPFGYGLSYTKFEYELLGIEADQKRVTAKVKIINAGEYPGREIAEVYYSAPEGALEKPYQELAAFAKTKTLAPGESETLAISFETASMASYNEKLAAWILEKGEYVIRVGASSRDTAIAGVVTLGCDVVTKHLTNRMAANEPLKEISRAGAAPIGYPDEAAQIAAAPRIALDASAFVTEKASYRAVPNPLPAVITTERITASDVLEDRATVRSLAENLSREELVAICIGENLMSSESIIGMASTLVPGAAGQTTSMMSKTRGIPSLILADGPAGLRLMQKFEVSRKTGKLKTVRNPLAIPGAKYLAPYMRPRRPGPAPAPIDENETFDAYYQFCTAIPIGTLLAQSWDPELIAKMGELIGKEMIEFGVDLWLAPGMNIHRNPLCGRNFEYYSEDPLVAGICAAGCTLGVQSIPGVGTTIKHFAANSQENNRMGENNVVSERALREIYLRNFEIAVEASQPMAIMTSYNRINGTQTANSYDLVTAILRDEWGFEGLVMTDWGTTGSIGSLGANRIVSYASQCVYVGNDLTMPGVPNDADNINRALDGEKVPEVITLGSLVDCAERILRIVFKSAKVPNAKPYDAPLKEAPARFEEI